MKEIIVSPVNNIGEDLECRHLLTTDDLRWEAVDAYPIAYRRTWDGVVMRNHTGIYHELSKLRRIPVVDLPTLRLLAAAGVVSPAGA